MTQTRQGTTLPALTDYGRVSASLGVVLKQFRGRETVHAYLLTGARGLGKRTFAKVLASALFCTSEHRPCGVCDECRRVADGNHPDVITVFADDGKMIGVDRVREVIRQVSQHSFAGGMRAVLVEPVERMTPQAQNCLLKSLEEPVANVVFLLMTHELTATLGTIASRCVRVKLVPWPDDVMKQTLQRLGYEAQAVDELLPRCGGNIGQAMALLNDAGADDEIKTLVMDAMRATSDAAIVGISTKLKESRDSADRCLNELEQAVHLALMARTGRLDPSVLRQYPPVWQAAAARAPESDFTALLGAVFEARKLKAGQVNWQSNIDHLLMKLLEEQTKWQQWLA